MRLYGGAVAHLRRRSRRLYQMVLMIVLEYGVIDNLVKFVGNLVQPHVFPLCARRAICRRIMAYVWLALLSRVVRSTTVDIVRVTGIEMILQLLGLVEVELLVGLRQQ